MRNESPAVVDPEPVGPLSAPCQQQAPPAIAVLNFARHEGDKIGSQGIGFSGVAGFFAAWFLANALGIMERFYLLPLFFGCAALPMVLLNLLVVKTQLRPSSGLLPDASPREWRRYGIKMAGIAFTLGCIAFLYWLFPEYSRDFYQPVWQATWILLLPAVILTAIYVAWVDRRMADPYDAYWHAGLIAVGRWRECDLGLLKTHGMGWLVKGFFLPLMAAGAAKTLSSFVLDGVDLKTFGGLYSTGINLIYAVDVSFGAIGYILTLRVLDAHIRSVEPTGLGWASAIICYVPFSPFVWGTFLKYRGEIQWHDWLSGSPIIYVTWGFLIVVLLAIYVWATISFGCRFSNLTNRGIIVDGPYRFMKHPAYVAKNLAWWLLYIPFAAHGTWDAAVKACICLLLTNYVYYLRAKTEERHLRSDPAYREYCGWVEANGLLAQARLLFKREVRSC